MWCREAARDPWEQRGRSPSPTSWGRSEKPSWKSEWELSRCICEPRVIPANTVAKCFPPQSLLKLVSSLVSK